MKTDKHKQETTQQHHIYYKQLVYARKSFIRAHRFIKKSARQITRRVAAISRADRWLRKLVVSHENGYIQAGNDSTASHLLLTISMCTKILCKSPQFYQKSARQITRRVAAISRAARQIPNESGVISRAARQKKCRLSHVLCFVCSITVHENAL